MSRRWQHEDYVVIGIAVVLILVLFFFLEGCKAIEVADSRILWVEGADCVMFAETLNAKQAKEIAKEMHLIGCDVKIENELNKVKEKER